jgi:threonyl-tRNA synthetase
MGVLIEHYGGSFPVWLAPVQAAVIPVSQNHIEYADKIRKKLKENHILVELDERNEKIGYKIRDWETKKIPYMLIVGEKEEKAGTISLRVHTKGDQGSIPVDEFIEKIKFEIDNKVINN